MMPTYRCAYCHESLGPAPVARCPHCGKAMILPHCNDTLPPRRKRKSTEPENAERENLPFVRPGKNPTILGAIILVFIVLGTLLTSRFEAPPATNTQQDHRVDHAWREVNTLAMALQKFHQDTGRYPSEAEGLKALVQNPGIPGWGGYYVNLIQPDPWKTPYRYSLTPLGPEVRSAGPDRTFNTDADICAIAETTDAT